MTATQGTLPLPHIGLSMPRSADLAAGVTSGCVIVPCAVAYASLAGLPLQTGLYASLAALLAYALLSTSPLLSVSITSTLGILTADALGQTIPSGDTVAYVQGATTLALLAGIILVIVGFLRLGFLAEFISLPALTGFKIGLGLWIASSQLGKLLGIPFTSESFFKNIRQAFDGLGEVSTATLGFTLLLFACVFAVRLLPRNVPVALVLVAVGIGMQIVFNLESHGVALIGDLPKGLPSLQAPSTDYLGRLVPAAIGIAVMAGFESIAIGRVVAPVGTRPKVNRDCVAIGGANLLASFFQGMPAAGGGTQTLVNAEAGARSKVSQVVAAGVVVLGLTVLAPLFSYLPQASLGVVIVVAAAGMVAPKEMLAIRDIEYAGLESLIEMARDLSAEGTELWFAELNARPVMTLRRRMSMKRVAGISPFGHVRQAVSFYDESISQRTAA